MADIYFNVLSGLLSSDPGSSGTTLNSANFANMPAVAAPDTMRLTLDPDGVNGLPEIVIVTAHTAAATSCTVTRGQETSFGGAAGHAHPINTPWRHATTRLALEELPYRKVTTKGDLIAATGLSAVARFAAGANDTRLVADSTQASGLRYAPDTENKLIATKGDLLAGTANDTVAVLPAGANDTRLVADSAQASGLRYASDTENKLISAKGDLLVGTANDTIAVKAVGTDGTRLTADAASVGGVKWNSGALTTWVPVLAQGTTPPIAISSARFKRDGRWIEGYAEVAVTGEGGTAGTAVTITLPVAHALGTNTPIGTGFLYDASAAGSGTAIRTQLNFVAGATSTTARAYYSGGTADILVGVAGNGGFSGGLATNDVVAITFAYEAAAD